MNSIPKKFVIEEDELDEIIALICSEPNNEINLEKRSKLSDIVRIIRIRSVENEIIKPAQEKILDLIADYIAQNIYTARKISCIDAMKMAKYIGTIRSKK